MIVFKTNRTNFLKIYVDFVILLCFMAFFDKSQTKKEVPEGYFN